MRSFYGTITRTYDALNRVSSYTDTYGKVIRYEYDAVGNLSKIIYPDNTAVTYAYDANHNLVRVTDWANRVTTYTYDVNNRVVGVTKPDGSVTTTVYDNKQRVTSTVERTATGAVITGFEYTYDDLSRIIEEKVLANSTKMCYTYDSLSRVTARTLKKLSDNSVVSTETFNYDAAGNVTSAPDSSFQYDTNNRLISFNGNTVSYDLDGNMLSNGTIICTYDSANRLITADGHTYTYNAEDVRIRNLCAEEDTTYVYNTNCKLSQLLVKTTNGVTTKYVYGLGLIGEEANNTFKTYHFDSRGSTIAITDASGNITDTFAYDTYGKCISRTGSNTIIFGYNGRDGVVTDKNGLIYMRARYYSPNMRRFVNADIIHGKLNNAVTLNRYAYANANPVSNIDPLGLYCCMLCGDAGCDVCLDRDTLNKVMSGEISNPNKPGTNNKSITSNGRNTVSTWLDTDSKSQVISKNEYYGIPDTSNIIGPQKQEEIDYEEQYIAAKKLQIDYDRIDNALSAMGYAWDIGSPIAEKAIIKSIKNMPRPNNIGKGTWAKQIDANIVSMNKAFNYAGYGITSVFTIVNTGMGIEENIQNGESTREIISDAAIDIAGGVFNIGMGVMCAKVGAAFGTTISPILGTTVGAIVGFGFGLLTGWEYASLYDESIAPTLDNIF